MVNKSRPLMGKKVPSPDPITDVCPHQHFKSDVIDRRILSRKQHLNLLCTPKGYRWIIKDVHRPRKKIPRGTTGPCRLLKKKPGKTYVHDILAELWDLITPEMAQRMKEMLMAEFGLSEEAAWDFICHSRYDTSITANPKNVETNAREDDRPPEGSTLPHLSAARKLGKNDFNVDLNPFHIRAFSKAVSSKLSNYVAAMTCAKRDPKHRIMAETILKGLCDLTGEETTLDSPKNRLHKILTFASDRLALLMVDNMENENERRMKRRKREDRTLKRIKLARQRERKMRQKEKDKMYKEKEKNEKRRAAEEAEKSKWADEEREQKRLEREKRHQEMDKFREEEKQRRKEMKRSKAEGERSKPQSRGGQPGTKSKPVLPGETRRNYKPTSEQTSRDAKAGLKRQPDPKSRAIANNQGKSQQASKTRAPSTNLKTTNSRKERLAPESLSGGPANEKPERVTSQSGDTGNKINLNHNELKQEISKASQLSKSVIWGDDVIKNISSPFSASGKITATSSQSSSIDKLVDLLSSQGKAASKIPPERKSASSRDQLLAAQSSQGILAKVIRSQGKLVSEQKSHSKLGAASTSDYQIGRTHDRRNKSILKVKRTVSDKFEVNRTTYVRAKNDISALRRKSLAQVSSPTPPFDPNDPKSWEQWVEYATRMAEDWRRWIDDTIHDTEAKAILYQAKAREGKADPQDVEDWNTFLEQTNEDARRWRRLRKAMMDAANEWKQS